MSELHAIQCERLEAEKTCLLFALRQCEAALSVNGVSHLNEQKLADARQAARAAIAWVTA